MHGQDWETVYIRKKVVNPTDKNAVTQARRNNQTVDTNARVTDEAREYSARARKLESDLHTSATDEAPSPVSLLKLSHVMRQELIRSRTNKKMNQQDLAHAVHTQTTVIKALEGGQVIQDKTVLTRINNLLGTKLKFNT
jgi:ribosome-binding protein aMBF1 (putative translation factor)